MKTFALLAGSLALAVLFTITGSADAFAAGLIPVVSGPVAAPALLAAAALARGAYNDFAAFRARLKSGVAYEKREAPDLRSIADTLERLGKAFEERCKAQDEAIAELKAGGERPETTAKLAKLDAELDQVGDMKKQLELLQTRAARPGAGARAGDAQSAEEIEHRNAFTQYLRAPNEEREVAQRLFKAQKELAKKQGEDMWADKDMMPREMRAASTVVGTPASGGYALPKEIEASIAELGRDIAPIRQIATVRTVGTTDYHELIDVNGTAFEWLGEGDTRNQTNTDDLADIVPTFGMASAKPQASEESIEDLFFDVEGWLVERAALAIYQGEGAAFVSGNGTKKPTGFLGGPAPLSTADGVRAFGTLQYIPGGQAAAAPTNFDPFTDLIYAVRARYRANARWVLAKSFLATLRKYKDTTGQPLWQPSLILGQPDIFMGYPVAEAEDMPVVAANAFPVAFGDFREGYLIADRVGMRITRDDITTPGQVKFYIRKRVGGKLRNTEAIKLLKISTT